MNDTIFVLDVCNNWKSVKSTACQWGRPADFAKYRSLSFRDGAVSEIIHRVADKYSVKIESLKTGKAKKNWAEKYSKAFEPYLPYMSNAQRTEFVEVSEELSSLAEKDNMESE